MIFSPGGDFIQLLSGANSQTQGYLKLTSQPWFCIAEIFQGGPLNFGRVCRSIRPPKTMFCCIFKKEFWDCVVLWDQIFLEKLVKDSIHFREKFFSRKKCGFFREEFFFREKVLGKFFSENVIPRRFFTRTFSEKNFREE